MAPSGLLSASGTPSQMGVNEAYIAAEERLRKRMTWANVATFARAKAALRRGPSEVMKCESNPQKKAKFESLAFKLKIERRAEVEYELFEAIKYTEQFVAGMLYQIKYKVSKKQPVVEMPEELEEPKEVF